MHTTHRKHFKNYISHILLNDLFFEKVKFRATHLRQEKDETGLDPVPEESTRFSKQ